MWVLHGLGPFPDKYMTGDDGWVEIDSDGDANGVVDVQVHAYNTVVKVHTPILGSGTVVPVRVAQSVKFAEGESKEIPNEVDLFERAQMAKYAYDNGLRLFDTWGSEFAWGDEFDDEDRIDLVYPDTLWGPLAYTEPYSDPGNIASNHRPFIHLKSGDGQDTVTHELAHALHFAKLPESGRSRAESEFLQWLIAEVLSGNDATHQFDVVTIPIVAYIEAFGWFHEEFLMTTLSASMATRAQELFLNASAKDQSVRGDSTEGAVYLTLFVEYARDARIGLEHVVEHYIVSHALTYREFGRQLRRRFGAYTAEYQVLGLAGQIYNMPALPVPTVRELLQQCMGKSGVISLQDDVLGHPQVAASNPGGSLVQALNFIDRNCGWLVP